jgi:hypothetical protein
MMASKIIDEKAMEAGPLSINTTELHSHLGSALTPMTTTNSTEKGLQETSIDLHHQSSALSSPTSARQLNPYDTDIEAMGQSSENLNRKMTQCTGVKSNPNCTVWPGQDHWKQKARAAKRKNRSCQCMAHLSKRTRLIVKILIAILIIGIAVGVGVGISKPLGAGIWKPKDQ